MLSARVQFGVWVINRRLAYKHDDKADTLFQATMAAAASQRQGMPAASS